MDEAAGCLDEPLEIIGVLRFRPQPKMLENIVRLVIALLIPAAENRITGCRAISSLAGPVDALPSASTKREILWPLFTERLISFRRR